MSGMILVYVWRIQDLFPVVATLDLPIFFSVAALGLYIAGGNAKRLPWLFQSRIVRLVAAMLCFVAVSVPASLYPGLSFRFLTVDFAKTVLLFVLVATAAQTPGAVKRFALTHLVGAALYSWQVLTRIQIGESGRLGDLFYYDANDLALVLAATLPLLVYFTRREHPWWIRLSMAGLAPVMLITIVRTGSRGGFLGLIAAGAVLLFAYRSVSRWSRIASVGALTVLLIAVSGDRYWEMMGTLLHPTTDYNWSGEASGGRMEIWKRGMGYMLSHPITGVGASAFPVAEGQISELAELQDFGIGVKWSAAHNSFVQVGAELGILGLLCFCWVIAAAGRGLNRVARRTRTDMQSIAALADCYMGSLAAYCVAGFFLSQGYSAFLYALLGQVVGLAAMSGTLSDKASRPQTPPRRSRASRPSLPAQLPSSPYPERHVHGS